MVTIGCRLVTYGKAQDPKDPGEPFLDCNLGDVIQTVALSRHLPRALGVLRSGFHSQVTRKPFVINGFLYRPIANQGNNLLFAGIHVNPGAPLDPILNWLKTGLVKTIGARDPSTQQRLANAGLSAEMIGCATLTFDRHEGPRSGVYAIECDKPGFRVSHVVPIGMPFTEQWTVALALLEKYRNAKLVYTSRLYALLSCLAFGTPVVFVADKVLLKARLTLLEYLGVVPGRETVLDVTPHRKSFLAFLKRHLDIVTSPHDPVCPVTFEEYGKAASTPTAKKTDGKRGK